MNVCNTKIDIIILNQVNQNRFGMTWNKENPIFISIFIHCFTVYPLFFLLFYSLSHIQVYHRIAGDEIRIGWIQGGVEPKLGHWTKCRRENLCQSATEWKPWWGEYPVMWIGILIYQRALPFSFTLLAGTGILLVQAQE